MSEPDPKERRYLTVCRHAPTKKGEGRGRGSHLSSQGIALARQMGENLGPFHRVYASPIPRTLETAVAMGFAVDDILEFSCGYVSGEFEHHDQWGWDKPYLRFAELLQSGGTLAKRAAADAQRWIDLLAEVPSDGRVLIVSHGGTIEPILVACLPDAEHGAWGSPFSHCDSVTLTFVGSGESGRFIAADFEQASRYQGNADDIEDSTKEY